MQPDDLTDDILGAFDGICYVVDSEGVIRHIGARRWNAFARENGAPELDAGNTVGRNLFDYIQGETVCRKLTDIMAELSRSSGDIWISPFRCDSPGEQRNMRLAVTGIHEGKEVTGYLFQSVLLEADSRPPMDIYDFKAMSALLKIHRNLPILSMCSYCQRVRDDRYTTGEWASAETYYRRGGGAEVAISHGICDSCNGGAIERLSEL
ncbi:MAG: hypothetical protein WD767_08780 [Alphaproteobacteria bacterium]